MSQISLRLYGTPGATGITSNLANILIPRSGRVTGALLHKMLLGTTADGPDLMQISVVSVAQFTINDAQGVLADLVTYYNYSTSADFWVQSPSVYMPLNLVVVAGQKIYLHVDAHISTNAYFCNLTVEI